MTRYTQEQRTALVQGYHDSGLSLREYAEANRHAVERHAGKDGAILAERKKVLEAAKQKTPERWSRSTRNCNPIKAVILNPDKPVSDNIQKAG